MNEGGTLADREPVRLPLWIAGLGPPIIALAVDLLSDVEWRSALIGFLLTVGPVMFGVEIARQRAWSPASVWLATVQARRDEQARALNAGPYGPAPGVPVDTWGGQPASGAAPAPRDPGRRAL